MKNILFICLFVCLVVSDKAIAIMGCDEIETPKVSLVFHGRLQSFSIVGVTTINVDKYIRGNKEAVYHPFPRDKYKLYKATFEVLKVTKGDYKEKTISVYSLENLDDENKFMDYHGEELVVEATTFQDWYKPARIKGMRKDLLEKYDIKLLGDLENSYWIPDNGCNSYDEPYKLQRVNVKK
jgi:hypothetical protein